MKKSIRLVSLYLIGTTLLLLSSGGACRHQKALPPEAPDMALEWVHLFDDGNKKEVELSSQVENLLVSEVKKMVAESAGVLRLALTPSRVQGYRQQGEGLEMAFIQPDSFSFAKGTRSIKPNRIFILWGGDLVGEGSDGLVVMYGYPEYSAGPLPIKEGRSQFLKIINSLPFKPTDSDQ